MFGLEFLFIHALWALPLAGLPVLLHLLFRRKSPVVPFSTLRFIRSSVQHTAARKRVQRWLLLACRALLLLLLIWAVAQPAKMLASSWFGSGSRSIAAIVVDTSYSMELQDGQITLLARGGAIVEDLLRNELRDAEVALFRSASPTGDAPDRLQSASALLSQWTPLTPQPRQSPLIDRISAAVDLLDRQDAAEKWLFIVSDLQSGEFPRALPSFDHLRVVVIDLHPDDARSAGVTQVQMHPDQPIPGIAVEASVQLAGRVNDTRATAIEVQSFSGQSLLLTPPQMATFDASGKSRLRFPLKLPTERWLLINASLQADDALAWDNQRSHLIEIPPRRHVRLQDNPRFPAASRVVRLALDPSEGRLADWPIAVRVSEAIDNAADTLVLLLHAWPDEPEALRLRDFVIRGGSLILFLQPGIEQSWTGLTPSHQQILTSLLPAVPLDSSAASDVHQATPTGAHDALIQSLTNAGMQWSSLSIRRLVPMLPADASATTLLSAAPSDPAPGQRPLPLLLRRPIGNGIVHTWTTLPENRFTNLATHPAFLPMLVRMSLRSTAQGLAQNVELGEPLVLSGKAFDNVRELQLETPAQAMHVVPAQSTDAGNRFVFTDTAAAGLYRWFRAGEADPVAIGNVRYPSAEADLVYRPADQLIPPADNILVARSIDQLRARIETLREPEPRWSIPIALVLLLLCAEALMGGVSQLWKPSAWR